MNKECHACKISGREISIPGGTIFASEHWLIEHELAPLGIGTMLVKPWRHCTGIDALTVEESKELGPIITGTGKVVRNLTHCDQIYAGLWAHTNWQSAHIHFIIQPVFNHSKIRHKRPGPFFQSDLFKARVPHDIREVEAFCSKARKEFAVLFHDRGVI